MTKKERNTLDIIKESMRYHLSKKEINSENYHVIITAIFKEIYDRAYLEGYLNGVLDGSKDE